MLSRGLEGEARLIEVPEDHDEEALTAASPLLSSPLHSEDSNLRLAGGKAPASKLPSPRQPHRGGHAALNCIIIITPTRVNLGFRGVSGAI